MSLSEMVLQKLQSVIALGTDQNDNGTSHAVNDVDIGGRSILHHAALVRFKDGDGRDAIADAVRTFLHLKGDPNLQVGGSLYVSICASESSH